jgi:2-phosphosulfolactate phosphatase
MARGASQIVIGTFTNLSFISEWILTLKRNVIILCSGWQETLSLEDTLFAGALTDLLVQGNKTSVLTDSAYACIDLWNAAKVDISTYLKRGAHYQRLVNLGAQNDLDFALRLNSTRVVPVFENYYLINILK